jgi:hypothetical protein
LPKKARQGGLTVSQGARSNMDSDLQQRLQTDRTSFGGPAGLELLLHDID